MICPNCGSNDIQAVSEVHGYNKTKGFDCCSGVLGRLCLGPFGWLCGLCGMGKSIGFTTTSVLWVCNKCGEKFKKGKIEDKKTGNELIETSQNNDTRECPYCAETIKKKATVCRFCGKDVEPIEDEHPEFIEGTLTAVVNRTFDLRYGSDPDSIETVNRGERVIILKQTGIWSLIRTNKSNEGLIISKYLSDLRKH
jgi:DNA-directed RNA polymerase subunit RPC12/RpoP